MSNNCIGAITNGRAQLQSCRWHHYEREGHDFRLQPFYPPNFGGGHGEAGHARILGGRRNIQ
jgi:hypothetical protein